MTSKKKQAQLPPSQEPKNWSAADVLEHARVACLLTDLNGNILWANATAASLLGASQRHLPGKPLVVFVTFPGHQKYFALLEHLRAGDVTPDAVFPLRRRRGSPFTAACLVSRSFTYAGEPIGIWILSDCTAENASSGLLKRVNREFESSKAEVASLKLEMDKALRDKSAIIAHLVHEVRTPLQAAIGAAELLQKTNLTPEQEGLIHSVSVAARQLKEVADAVLSLTRVELLQPVVKASEFNLDQLLDDVCGQFRVECDAKHLYLRKFIAEDVPSRVSGDELRLRQILLNLISNALKFTQTGGITVAVSRFRQSKELLFSVADTGSGMSEHVVEHLFDPFTSANKPPSRAHGSTALGLYICKTLVESLHGRIAAESTIGRGTTLMFTALLPASDDAHRDGKTPRTEGEDEQAKLPPLRVLLAEDSELTARVVGMQLSSMGCQVVRVADGAQAVQAIKDGQFDMILMDCNMPGLDGYGATQTIRQLSDQEKSKVPILALTASAGEDDRSKCLGAGMNEYLPKPVGTEELRQAIRNVLRAAAKKSNRVD